MVRCGWWLALLAWAWCGPSARAGLITAVDFEGGSGPDPIRALVLAPGRVVSFSARDARNVAVHPYESTDGSLPRPWNPGPAGVPSGPGGLNPPAELFLTFAGPIDHLTLDLADERPGDEVWVRFFSDPGDRRPIVATTFRVAAGDLPGARTIAPAGLLFRSAEVIVARFGPVHPAGGPPMQAVPEPRTLVGALSCGLCALIWRGLGRRRPS